MNRKGDLLNKSYRIAEAMKAMQLEMVEYFKDKSIPLAERWEVFSEATGNGTFDRIEPWVMHIPIFEEMNLNWYDDFYIERNQLVEFNFLVNESIPDCIEFSEGDVWKDFDIDALKEEILQLGFSGFRNDW